MKDMTQGSPFKVIMAFSVPLIIGNLFQQLYNVVDSIIVGKFVGKDALAAVGSSFTIMVFITSILLGLCMGAGIAISQLFGAQKLEDMKNSIITSFLFIGAVTILLNLCSLLFLDEILVFMNIPNNIFLLTKNYLSIIFSGLAFSAIYNWSSALLRSLGDSKTPLYFLILSAILNVFLDLFFILELNMGVSGAALATIISQALSAVLSFCYCLFKLKFLKFRLKEFKFNLNIFKMTVSYSLMTSLQQSIMNFGILLIQGLVNSFGIAPMAAFAAAAKIDSFAYMPVQDFGNAFATFIAQNSGAGRKDRIKLGMKSAFLMSTIFCILISILVIFFSSELMQIFIKAEETEIIALGQQYLLIVGFFYCLIGYLFLFYGFYRGIGSMKMSVLLTVISLGTRVALAYILSPMPAFGLTGIWWAIPIGWLLADLTGIFSYKSTLNQYLNTNQCKIKEN